MLLGRAHDHFRNGFIKYEDTDSQAYDVSFERQLEVSENLIQRWNDASNRRTGICLIMPVYKADDLNSDPACPPRNRVDVTADFGFAR